MIEQFALAQHDFLVGDIKGNLRKALESGWPRAESGADLLLFPELALTGYPPEDLLLRPGFLEAAMTLLTPGGPGAGDRCGYRASLDGEWHALQCGQLDS